MKKGEIYEGVITDYDFPNKASLKLPKGDGSGDTVKVTIKGALPGQKIRFMITKKKSGMAEGRVLELLEKSPLEDGVELVLILVCVEAAHIRVCHTKIS
jgi:tRNA/tmRNA/rRNA uracil-C5-methylase (TrmA/RlmC/RlmD family)